MKSPGQLSITSRLKISPGSHSAITSKGRQQISQSVVNRCSATLVSITRSNRWPQNGHRMASEICIGGNGLGLRLSVVPAS